MINQRKQGERRSLEAAQLSLLNKTIDTQNERISELEMQLCERILMDDIEINALKEAGLWNIYSGKPGSLYIVERIKALESLLARAGDALSYPCSLDNDLRRSIIRSIDAILPKTEEVKDGN